MNAPRDPWADFAAEFAEELKAAMTLNAADLDRLAEEYQREAIATAQSEADQEAIRKEYAK